ncbi:MAG: hypothetical protein MJ193_02710 [Clostridia bacterium]|nr:hypothetical protein [Clostridia bacterium]
MTENYEQAVEVPISKQAKAYKMTAIVLYFMVLATVIVAVAVIFWVVIATAVMFILATVFMGLFNKTTKIYGYALNDTRIVIFAKDQLGKTKRIADILLEDVSEYQDFYGIVENDDLVYCGDTQAQGVKSLVFSLNGENKRMLFAPDEYFDELLNEYLKKQ